MRTLLDAIDEIHKGTPHAIEHSASLILRMTKRFTNPRFGVAENPVSVLLILLRRLIGLDVFHCRTGKHPFRSGHVPAVRSDMNGADRPTATAPQSHDPDRLAAFVSSQG